MRTYILNATGADISPATIIICVVIAAICIFAVISYRIEERLLWRWRR